MPRPGFYNDNEYRAYPFIYSPDDPLTPLPTSAIVDCGIIMGLDANFNDATDSVWLQSVARAGSNFVFTLATSAVPAKLIFVVPAANDEWVINHSQSSVAALVCAQEPIWEGFLVTGPLKTLRDNLSVGSTLSFDQDVYTLEPGCIQNLNKAYLRSISVGNYSRVTVPECGEASTNTTRSIVANAQCLNGDIRLKEGYNCQITQTDRVNEITVTAYKGAGTAEDSALCAAGSELPFYIGEPLAPNSKFYSGGPACDELISTINGLGGPNVNIAGGNGINVIFENNTIKVQKRPNSQVTCT